MDNQDIFDQFLQDVLQTSTNCMSLEIIAFIESFRALISTTYDDINTFVWDTNS